MKDFTGWKYYYGMDGVTKMGITYIHPTGEQESRLLIDPEVAAWITAGGVPLP